MKTLITYVIVGLAFTSGSAHAECYADYKAKRDDPLRLHYGVAEIPDAACGSRRAAARAIAPRLEAAGWTLLNVMDVFDRTQLQKRRSSAGPYFLRF